MVDISIYLVVFNLLFFWSQYTTWEMATSELLSTFFPSWVYIGRSLRSGKWPKTEPCYWLNFHAHPVLSTYYPPHFISAYLASFFRLDTQFRILNALILLHYLVCSIGWFMWLNMAFSPYVALFGAITFTYNAYSIRQQPCFVYTMTWIPFILLGIDTHSILLGSIAVGMSLVGGYLPLSVYILPATVALRGVSSLVPIAMGLLLASPQLIPFLKYLPKTIRTRHSKTVPVGPWERRFYFGLAPLILLIFSLNTFYLVFLIIPCIAYLFRDQIPRVHQRSWILAIFPMIYCSLGLLTPQISLLALIIQAFDLWAHNHALVPTRPYSEAPKRPERAFNTRLTRYLAEKLGNKRVSGLPHPLFTGIINGFNTLGYCGGMQLKSMAKWRGDTTPGGGGAHDWFKVNSDNHRLDVHRVKYAFTRKRIDWEATPIRNLYSNPRLS